MAVNLDAAQAAAIVYQNSMELAAQQLTSRLKAWADLKTGCTGKNQVHRKVMDSEMEEVTTRLANTNPEDAVYQARVISPRKGHKSFIVDEDDMETLDVDVSPTGTLTQATIAAANRFTDRVMLEGIVGANYELAADGSYSSVSLGSGQQVAIDFGSAGTNTGLTLGKLAQAKSIFGRNEVYGQQLDSARLCMAVSQRQLDDLLVNVTQVGSSDYNDVKALVDGKVDYFMGIYFLRTEQVAASATTFPRYRTCPVWIADGIHLDVWYDAKTSISVRNDKMDALQVRTRVKLGCGRKDEDRVVLVYCNETA